MDQGFIDIINKLISERGKETFLNYTKCKAFLADYTKGDYKKESRLLLQALEAGVQKAINTAGELAPCKKQQAKILQEEHFLTAEAAAEVIDTLAFVLRGEKSKTKTTPAKAGKVEGKPADKSKTKTKTSQTQMMQSENTAGQTVQPAMILVEGGTFQMGSNDGDEEERPVHTVTVKSFYMGKYQVTQKEWQEVMGNNPSEFKGDNLPVENVNWYDVIEYCNKRSIKEELTPVYSGSGDNIICNWNANGYRLPTEAEWEFAAKGGGKDSLIFEYSGSNSPDVVGWYDGNSRSSTHPVGTKAPNSLGIYDMSGNVGEWCWDWYGDYSSGSQTDPSGAVSGAGRVLRGGSWGNAAAYVRSASRGNDTPSFRDNFVGFRLVRP